MNFLIFLIIIVVVSLLIEKLMRKWLGVEKRKISETSGKNIKRWGENIILLILLCSLPFVNIENADIMKWYGIFFLTLILGLQSFVEWKYLKNSKEYVITLIILMVGLINVYIANYFL